MKNNKYIYYIIALILTIALLTTGCSTEAKGLTNVFNNDKKDIQIFDNATGVVSQGVIEAQEVSLNSKIPGKIAKLYVEEGKEIKAGEILIEISSDELQAKKEQAQAVIGAAQAAYKAAKGQVDAANAMLEKAQNGAREQEIAQAESYYALMVKTYDRVEKLFEKGAVSAQKKDEVQTQLDVAEQQLSMAKEGARSEDISGAQALVAQALAMEQAAKGKLEQAQAGLQEVEAYLKDTKITSPINGVITVINADEGELVSTGMSIATVTNLNKTWVEVNVKETDLANISLGQQVDAKVPSFSDSLFTGKVVRINQKPDFATKRSTNDNGEFDILSFSVKIELDNKDKVFRPGMTAFVHFKN